MVRWTRAVMAAMIVAASSMTAAAGRAATSGTAGAAAPPAGIRADEGLAFPAFITGISLGPSAGDLLLTFADGGAEVVRSGRVTLHLAPQVSAGAGWVPGTGWVAAQGAGSAPQHGTPYYLTPADGGPGVRLPVCPGGPEQQYESNTFGLQMLPGAVAWVCPWPPAGTGAWSAARVYVLRLPPAPARVDPASAAAYDLPMPAQAVPGAVAVTPSLDMAAVQYAAGGLGVRVYALKGGRVLPGAFVGLEQTIVPVQWSPAGDLALADAHAVDLWNLASAGPPVVRIPTTDTQWVRWLPGGVAALVLDRLNPAGGPPQFALLRAGLDGGVTRLMRGRLGYVLGPSADGRWLWREEGVAATIDAPSAPSPGQGPFHLRAVPIPQVGTTMMLRPVDAVAGFDPGRFEMETPRVGWAASHGPPSAVSGIFRTVDGGAHWYDVTPPLRGNLTYNLDVQALDAERAFTVAQPAWTAPGTVASPLLFFTQDGGASWRQLSVPASAPGTLRFQFEDARHIYAVAQAARGSVVYSTADAGAHWSVLADTRAPGPSARGLPPGAATTVWSLTFHGPDDGWALGDTYHSRSYTFWLYATHDGGRRWAPVTVRVPPALRALGPPQLSPPRCFSATDCTLVAAFGDHQLVVYVSADAGRTWAPTVPPLTEPARWVAISQADGQHWFVSDGTRLYVTADAGRHWSVRGLPVGLDLRATTLEFVNATHGWMVQEGSDFNTLLATADGGRTWRPGLPAAIPQSGLQTGPAPVGRLALWGTAGWSAGSGGLFRTSDGGVAWTDVSPPELLQGGALPRARDALVASPTVAWLALADGRGQTTVWATYDAGANWSGAAVPAPAALLPLALSFADRRSGWLLLGTAADCATQAPALYATTDGGRTWTRQAARGLPADTAYVTFTTPETGWAAGHGLAVTRDGGRTWSPVPLPAAAGPVEAGPPADNGAAVGLQFLSPAVAYAWVQSGTGFRPPVLVLYHTTDGGATWRLDGTVSLPRSAPIEAGAAWSVFFTTAADGWATAGDSLYATTDGGRTWAPLLTDPGLAWPSPPLTQVDFAGHSGWAVTGAAGGILRSTDGGRTWRRVAAQFDGITGSAGTLTMPAASGCP